MDKNTSYLLNMLDIFRLSVSKMYGANEINDCGHSFGLFEMLIAGKETRKNSRGYWQRCTTATYTK